MSKSTVGTSDFIAYLTPIEVDKRLDYINAYILFKDGFYLGLKSTDYMIILDRKEADKLHAVLNPKPNHFIGTIIGLLSIIYIGSLF
jgi:hypothetical protein